MYFIDVNHYEYCGRSITHESYIKSKKGIQPKHFKNITRELILKKQLFLRKEDYYHRTIHRYYPLIIPAAEFGKKELAVIDSSINELIGNNATSITKYAKNDSPLILADFGEIIDYKHVEYRTDKYSVFKKNK